MLRLAVILALISTAAMADASAAAQRSNTMSIVDQARQYIHAAKHPPVPTATTPDTGAQTVPSQTPAAVPAH